MNPQPRMNLNGTVLIVDDSQSERELVREFLGAAHPQLELLEAPNGPTALQIMSSSSVDLVILDYRLPVVDGLEVLKHLVAEYEVPVIMVTGMGSQDIAVQALNLGALDYVTKSIGYHKGLPMLVERHLVQARQSQKQQQMEVHYEALVEHSHDPIYQLKEGKFIYVNRAMEQLFGYSREDMTGPDFDMNRLLTASAQKLVAQRQQSLQQGEEPPSLYTFTGLTREEREVELEANVSYLLQPDGTYLTQGVLRELTDRPAISPVASLPASTASPGRADSSREPGVDLTVTDGTAKPSLDADLLNQLNNDLAYAKANIADLFETVQLGSQLINTVKELLQARSDNVRQVCLAQLGPLLEENEVVFEHADKSLKAVLEGLEKIATTLHDQCAEARDRSPGTTLNPRPIKLE